MHLFYDLTNSSKKNKMSKTKNIPNLVHYDENTKGRDFVVGDLHGCVEDLLKVLLLLNFDSSVDRVFSVGDLVDRGPNSMKTADLVYEDWFFAVKGNHEELMYESILRDSYQHVGTWAANGGLWSYNEDKAALKSISKKLEQLPYVITVGEGANRFNIVHGELKFFVTNDEGAYERGESFYKRVPVTDAIIDQWLFTRSQMDDMLWGRTIISNGNEDISKVKPHEFWHDMEKMSLTFVGHTPVAYPVQVQRQVYIDTGAVYHHTSKNQSERNMLTVACPTEKKIYMYNMLWKTITSIGFDELQVLG